MICSSKGGEIGGVENWGDEGYCKLKRGTQVEYADRNHCKPGKCRVLDYSRLQERQSLHAVNY